MNEALWLTTNSTREMVQYVADWTSERKLRLFATLLTHPHQAADVQ